MAVATWFCAEADWIETYALLAKMNSIDGEGNSNDVPEPETRRPLNMAFVSLGQSK
jgi:hypothetical protein